MRVPCQRIEVTLDRMVMPRSRSRSLESMARSATRWLSRKEPACCRSRSTSVVLPWSTWAMIATLRNVMQEIRWGPARPGQALRCNIGSASPTATPKSAKCLNDQEDAAAQRPPAALRRPHFLHQYRTKCGGSVRSSVAVKNVRRVLCVFPAYTPSFGTFAHAYKLMQGVRAFMPPQGLLTIAAYLPENWPFRFIDENMEPASAADLAWADVVLVSGMHFRPRKLQKSAARAKPA